MEKELPEASLTSRLLIPTLEEREDPGRAFSGKLKNLKRAAYGTDDPGRSAFGKIGALLSGEYGSRANLESRSPAQAERVERILSSLPAGGELSFSDKTGFSGFLSFKGLPGVSAGLAAALCEEKGLSTARARDGKNVVALGKNFKAGAGAKAPLDIALAALEAGAGIR